MFCQKSINHVFAVGLLIALLACCRLATAEEFDFTEDAKAAIAKSVKEKKDILMFFTGSDWCPPCKMLEEEVMSEEEFLFEASKHYVLVKFDFPKGTEQDPDIVKQNESYSKKYGITGFPTVVLTDNKLKPFAIAGYEPGGFQNYLGMLEESRKLRINRDEKLKLAADKSGAERAKLLDQAIMEMREEIVNVYYPEIIAEIVEIDKDNKLGLRKKWNAAEDAETRKIVMTDLMMISRVEKPSRAIAFIDEVIDEFEFTDAEKLRIFQIKLNLVRQLKDDAMVDAVLDQMIGLESVAGVTRERLIVKKFYLMVGSNRQSEAMELLDESIAADQSSTHLLLAKGSLHAAKREFTKAIEAYDEALKAARANPDMMIDLVSAKADALYELDKPDLALQALDDYAEDSQMPSDLRAEALLNKAMIMRDMNRSRQARLAENRAIEITESAKERAELQKIVDRLREKFGG